MFKQRFLDSTLCSAQTTTANADGCLTELDMCQEITCGLWLWCLLRRHHFQASASQRCICYLDNHLPVLRFTGSRRMLFRGAFGVFPPQ